MGNGEPNEAGVGTQKDVNELKQSVRELRDDVNKLKRNVYSVAHGVHYLAGKCKTPWRDIIIAIVGLAAIVILLLTYDIPSSVRWLLFFVGSVAVMAGATHLSGQCQEGKDSVRVVPPRLVPRLAAASVLAALAGWLVSLLARQLDRLASLLGSSVRRASLLNQGVIAIVGGSAHSSSDRWPAVVAFLGAIGVLGAILIAVIVTLRSVICEDT